MPTDRRNPIRIITPKGPHGTRKALGDARKPGPTQPPVADRVQQGKRAKALAGNAVESRRERPIVVSARLNREEYQALLAIGRKASPNVAISPSAILRYLIDRHPE